MTKPYAESCDQNRDPILSVIGPMLAHSRELLEIGSGTGQHAVYFAAKMPHLSWQCSDQPSNLPGICAWLDEAGLVNTPDPIELDVDANDWHQRTAEAVFSANTAHIMPWATVQKMFMGVGSVLEPGGTFILYGPFNYDGAFTSDSNARFDAWLKRRDPRMGIRNFEDLVTMASEAGLELQDDIAMPANNRILVWQRA